MNKSRVASIAHHIIETMIPTEVRQWLKYECPVVVNDLSQWDIPSHKRYVDKELLGIFGFENGKPIIGINHKTLKTAKEVIRTTLHEVAHFSLWMQNLPNGERATNKLARIWEAKSL